MAELSEQLTHSIVSLGQDLFALKLYWVAVSFLWLYDYALTLDDEIEYAWKGKKSPVFWLFILNRYLCPTFIVISLSAYFLDSWTPEICARYESLEPLGTAILTTIAELFMTLRVYALLKRNKAVLFVAGVIILWQWALIMYVIVQASKGTTHLAFLLSRDVAPALPTLPTTDPYHVCIFIVSPALVPWAEAFLCLCLSFDGLAFIGIIFGIAVRRREMNTQSLAPVTTIIRRDGVLYFFVLFSSNLVFLLVARYARPGLKNIHNQPAMVISAIMVNRITLNLKRESYKQLVLTWGTKTFLPVSALHSKGKLSQDIEMEPRTFREAEGTPRSFEHD